MRLGGRRTGSGKGLSYVYVIVQFAAIAFIGLTGPLIAHGQIWKMMEALAFIPGTWAVIVMLPERFNIIPEVRTGSRLVTTGPYRFLRHPMYSSVLLTSLSLVIDAPDVFRAVAWCVLFVDLILKMRREEGFLLTAFPGYASYLRDTWRVVPWVF